MAQITSEFPLMEAHHLQPGWTGQNGSVVITFHNAAHLLDSFRYATTHGKQAEFYEALARLVLKCTVQAAPRPASSYEDTKFPAVDGRKVITEIRPDTYNQPSFAGWHQDAAGRNLGTFGLIFHRDGEWLMHT